VDRRACGWSNGVCQHRLFDLVVGGAIGVYVVKEAIEILSEAREARAGEECRDDD
jgi:hypothetical protein